MYMLAEIQPPHCTIICLALRRSAIIYRPKRRSTFLNINLYIHVIIGPVY